MGSSRPPLDQVKRALRRGMDVDRALALELGDAYAARAVSVFQRVKLGQVQAPEESNNGRRNKRGHRYPGPRTAIASFASRPLCDANAPHVRRQARALVYMLGWMRQDRRGNWVTGHPAQGHRLCMSALALACGVGVREVERFLAVLESGGLIHRWQPPTSSDAPKGNLSGHCFQMYALKGDAPRALVEALTRWHGSARVEARAQLVEAPRVEAPAGELDGLRIAEWLKRGKTGPPS